MAVEAGRVLKASSLELMRTPTKLSDGTALDYGLGTRIGKLDGHRVFGHTGGGGGFNAVMASFPDDHLSIVVLMNSRSGAGPSLALSAAIARALLGLPEKKTLRDLPVPNEELASLSPGTFTSDEGTVENFPRNGKLFFRDLPSRAEGPLLRQGENVYAVNENTEVHFVVSQHRATWAIVYTGGLMMDAVRRVK